MVEQEKGDRAFALSLSMQELGEQPLQERKSESASAGGWLHDGVKPRIATECLVTDGSAFCVRGKWRSLPGGFDESEPRRKAAKSRLSLGADVHSSQDEGMKQAKQIRQDWILARQLAAADEHSVVSIKETPGRHKDTRRSQHFDQGDAEMADINDTAEAVPQYPSHWTWCSQCPPGSPRRYHLITLHPGPEYDEVTKPLKDAGIQPGTVKRIQNLLLYRRLRLEQKLMEESHPSGWDVNEKNLFHVTSVSQEVIADEGLDLRLSRQGCFGTGIYFSDDPRKCNRYWRQFGQRFMVRCKVLLGDIKTYPRGHNDMSLRREPPKERPVCGDTKTYDSVKGNISGENEYVLYNQYRILPEYIIEYTAPCDLLVPPFLGNPAAVNLLFHCFPHLQTGAPQVPQLPVTLAGNVWMRNSQQPGQPYVFRASQPVGQHPPQYQQHQSLQHHHPAPRPVLQPGVAQPNPWPPPLLSSVYRAFLKKDKDLVKQFIDATGCQPVATAVQYLILAKGDLNGAVSSYLDARDSGKLV